MSNLQCISASLIMIFKHYECATLFLISANMFGARDKWFKEEFYLLFLSNLISYHIHPPMDVKFPERTGPGIVWVHARLLIKHSNIMPCIKDV